MATCADCGAPVTFVFSTSEGRVALDERMDNEGEDRWVLMDYTTQPLPTARRVSAGYERDCYVAHRKVCPFTS